VSYASKQHNFNMALLNFRLSVTVIFLWTARLVSAQVSPIVDLGYAQYQGTVNTANNVTHFLGIRYAAPPSGESSPHSHSIPTKLNGK
jgi:hypothetical protein